MMHFFLLYAPGIYRAPKTDDCKTKTSIKFGYLGVVFHARNPLQGPDEAKLTNPHNKVRYPGHIFQCKLYLRFLTYKRIRDILNVNETAPR